MFKLKLTALGHPNPDEFNCDDEKEYRSVILWLEDQKIRHYKIEDRENLRNIDSPDWNNAYDNYQKDLVSPVINGSLLEQLNWLLSYAVRLEYADNVEKYKSAKVDQPKKAAPNVVSSNPLDNLDFSSQAFKAGVERVCTLAGVGPHLDPKVRLAALAKVLKTSPHPHPTNVDSSILQQPTDVLKLLFLQDIRDLQTKINEALVAVQTSTEKRGPVPGTSRGGILGLGTGTGSKEADHSGDREGGTGGSGSERDAQGAPVKAATSRQPLMVSAGDKPAYKKKSGAERRKRALLKKQHAIEGGPKEGPLKRIRGPSDEATGSAGDSKRSKLWSFKDALTGVKMAIIADGHPGVKIEAGHMGALQATIWELLESTPDPLPIVNVGNIVAGVVYVLCDNQCSADWLGALNGKTVEGIKLKVIEAQSLPKPVKMAWKTRNVGCVETHKVLRMLQRLNPGLRTNEWRVVHTLKEGSHTRRVVLMDKTSADVIRDAGFTLQAGVDGSTFKLMDEANEGGGGARVDPKPKPVILVTPAENKTEVMEVGGLSPTLAKLFLTGPPSNEGSRSDPQSEEEATAGSSAQ